MYDFFKSLLRRRNKKIKKYKLHSFFFWFLSFLNFLFDSLPVAECAFETVCNSAATFSHSQGENIDVDPLSITTVFPMRNQRPTCIWHRASVKVCQRFSFVLPGIQTIERKKKSNMAAQFRVSGRTLWIEGDIQCHRSAGSEERELLRCPFKWNSMTFGLQSGGALCDGAWNSLSRGFVSAVT